MPQCIDDQTTASHRPVLWLQAYLVVQAIKNSVLASGNGASGELAISETAAQSATNLIVGVPFRLLGDPDVSPFYGEVHLTWTQGPKQIVLMCFPNRTPLVHHYLRVPNAPSVHDIEEASPESLAAWLRWLRG